MAATSRGSIVHEERDIWDDAMMMMRSGGLGSVSPLCPWSGDVQCLMGSGDVATPHCLLDAIHVPPSLLSV